MPQRNRFHVANIVIEIGVYVAILLAGLAVGITMERIEAVEHEESERGALLRAQATITERIQETLNSKHLFARGLAGAIALRPDLNEIEFSGLAGAIRTEDPSVVNTAIVRDKRITHVFPVAPNSALIGTDLSSVPRQAALLDEVERRGKTLVDGPVKLLQGFPGYVLREPVLLIEPGQKTPQLHSIASVVFAADRFLAELRLGDFADRFDVAIVTRNFLGETSFVTGTPQTLSAAREARVLDMMGMRWTLGLAPKAAIETAAGHRRLLRTRGLIVAGTIVALVAAWYLNRLRRENWRNATRLRAAVNALPSGFVLFDRNDRLQLCNERYRDFQGRAAKSVTLGASLESILRAGLDAGLYIDAKGRERDWLRRRTGPVEALGAQETRELSDGRWVQVLERRTPDGGRVSVLNDVTEPLESRRRARLAEQRLADAIDALPVGFWLFDGDHRLIMFNTVAGGHLPGMERALEAGRRLEDLVEKRMGIAQETWIEGHRIDDPVAVAATLAIGTSTLEVRYAGDLWFKYFSRPTSEGGVVMFRVNVTDLRRNQQVLEASNAELRAALHERDEAEARFRDVADLSAEWFWEQDAAGRLTHLTDGFRRITGLDPAGFLGKSAGARLVPFGEGDEAGTLRARMAAHEPFKDVVYSLPLPGPEGAPREIWLRLSGKPVIDRDGMFHGYIGTAEDVTRFYAALREARKADEAKTQFLNIISHELRTPLTAVLGFNAFVANSGRLPSRAALGRALEAGAPEGIATALEAYETELRGFAGRIRAAGTQLQSLIDDMLDLARIEANTIRIEPQPIDSDAVVRSVVEQMQTLAEEKRLGVTIDLAPATILADEIRFRQIVTNLFGNAVKFTDAGTITLSSRIEGEMAVFSVADSGIGIAPERLGIVFDRFAQAHAGTGTDRKNPGVGLGLAICRDLVRLQGGWIRAESTPGVGTVMSFALPLAPAA